MKIKVYDYDNRALEVTVPVDSVDEIEEIFVTILSGDETGHIKTKAGDIIPFDGVKAAPPGQDYRLHGYYDGEYCLTVPEQIKEWVNFDYEPDKWETMAYERQSHMYNFAKEKMDAKAH